MRVDTDAFEQLLLERKILEPEQMKSVRNRELDNHMPIQNIISELGYASKAELLHILAEIEGLEYVDLSSYVMEDANMPLLLGEKISRKFEMLALQKTGNTLVIAMKDPKNIFALDSARLISSLEVRPVLVDPDELNKRLDEVFKKEDEAKKTVQTIEIAAKSATKDKWESRDDSNTQSRKSSAYGKRIGELLIESKVINELQLETALDIQKKEGGLIGSIMVREGFITKKQLYTHLEKENGIPYFELENVEIPEDVLKLITRKIAEHNKLIPVEYENDVLKVAMSDPLNIFAIDDLRLATGLEIKPMFADLELIEQLIDKCYEPLEPEEIIEEEESTEDYHIDFEEEMERVKEEIDIEVQKKEQVETTINISDVEDAPIVRMLNMIFKNAVDKGASDIHLEAYEDCVMVRFRIDGQLVEIMKQDKKLQPILVARVKIISGLNIAEKRLPQDGRIALKINKRNFDFRVSVLPTMFGEKVVIRIMSKDGYNISKSQLGFFEDDLEKFDHILSHPHGIVLVTGPTGSGKSTTLYTALRELSKPNVNIMTVEDPVESTIRGINQVQVNQKAGMTFATALRSFLRQDPDIIMVGEIRDGETAEIAVRAAITGHLVLSTLHTNDAVSSISRLIDMGIQPFLIASCLVGVLAQRLVRRLCPQCKEEYEPDEHEIDLLKLEKDARLYKAVGCPACNETGYKGRIAVYEILTITSELRDMIARDHSAEALNKLALESGMNTLAESCSRQVKLGVTTIEEMMSAVSINEKGEESK